MLEADDSQTDRYGKFSCEPLERGFGNTLGNALRRVLLSSLQGAAIRSVRVEGVMHEFSSIPGVMEDMCDVVLNLKDVRLRVHSEAPKSLRIHRQGEGILPPVHLRRKQRPEKEGGGKKHVPCQSRERSRGRNRRCRW